nr:hypothetical protein [Kribbella catacumbae]
MISWVTRQDLTQPLVDVHRPTIRTRCQVAVGQSIEQVLTGRRELICQGDDPTLSRLDDGAAVVSYQATEELIGSQYIAEVACAVQRMKARGRDGRRISNVMQPTSDFHELGLRAQHLS